MQQFLLVQTPTDVEVSLLMACQWASDDYIHVTKAATESGLHKYISENSWCYWAAANSWLRIVQHVSGRTLAEICLGLLAEMGWRGAITWLATIADLYIRDNCTADHHVKDMMFGAIQQGFWLATRNLDAKDFLQVCRYLKRFTIKMPPSKCKLADEVIEKFEREQLRLRQEVEPRLDAIEQGCSPHEVRMVVGIARYLIRQILGDECNVPHNGMPPIGKGSARNVAKSPYDKYYYLMQLGRYSPTRVPQFFHYREHPDVVIRKRQGVKKKYNSNLDRPEHGGLGEFPQVCHLGSVPKKVDAMRLIAKEDPVNMSDQLRCKAEMERLILAHPWGEMMPLKDQSRNSKFAKLAARSGLWATVDWTAASDSVSKKLGALLLPTNWWRRLLRCIPTGYIVSREDAGPRKLHSAATMGCGCTFILLTVTMWSIAAASYVYSHMCEVGLAKAIRLLGLGRISVYGDDVIIPVSVLPLYYRVAAYLGFRLNGDKSFADGPFRESCGTDWLCRDDGSVELVTSVYWPRIPLSGSLDSMLKGNQHDFRLGEDRLICALEGLLSLQHRLWPICKPASEFISSVIRMYVPDMTCSKYDPLNEAPDLVAEEDDGIRAVFVGGEVPKRYRTVPSLRAVAPDGYVLWTCLEQFITDRGVDPDSGFGRLAFMRRTLHVGLTASRLSRSEFDQLVIDPQFYQSLLYDMALQPRQGESGITVWTDRGRRKQDLYACLGCRPDAINGERLLGCGDYTLTLLG